MSSGGTWMACSSVLNAVRNSHSSGNTSSSVAVQAAAVRAMRGRTVGGFITASLVEVLADEADQEHRGHVGQQHCEQGAGRGHADVEVHQRLLEDQEGDVGARVAGAAAGGREDL